MNPEVAFNHRSRLIALSGVPPIMPRSILGPLFWEEFFRLLRRGSHFRLRAALPFGLMVVLWLMYPEENRKYRPADQAQFAREMFWWVIGLQFMVVWFLTPLFAAAVLTEEREQKTLDLLLTTTLTSREIAAGKLLARLGFLAYILLAGLPLMAVMLSFGGFGPLDLLAAYACLFANLWGIGGLGAAIASGVRSYRAALYLTWFVLVLLSCMPFFGPWIGLRLAFDTGLPPWPTLVAFLSFNFGMGASGLFIAVRSVRRIEAAPVQQKRLRGKDAQEFPRPKVTRRIVARGADRPELNRPRGVSADIDWGNPPHECPGPSEEQILLGGFVLAAGLGLMAGMAMLEPNLVGRTWPAYMAMAWLPAAMIAAVQTSGTISREREGDTLTMLLTVPATRREILWRKYLRGLTLHLWLAGTTLTIALIVFLLNEEREWYFVFAVQGVGMIAAAASLGIWLTVNCKSTFLAQAAAVVGVLFLAIAPGWVASISDVDRSLGIVTYHYAACLLIAVAGWHLAVRRFYDYAR